MKIKISEKRNPEKLDVASKIILATGAINYMVLQIDTVNEQIRRVSKRVEDPDTKGILINTCEDRDRLLIGTVTALYNIMEELGDYMNENDCISPIDAKATAEAFRIVSGDNDNVNDEY